MSTEADKDRSDRLARLAALPDDLIDTTDIPEVRDWSGAVRGGLGKRRDKPAQP